MKKLILLIIVVMMTGCAVQKNEPKHYKGFYQQRQEFQKRQDANRHEQYRIQQNFKR